jgi:hypothetical protein
MNLGCNKRANLAMHQLLQTVSVADPGSGAFLPPRIRDAFIPDPTYFCIKAINSYFIQQFFLYYFLAL